MLWYKGWLETRFRLLFALGFVAFFLVSAASNAPKTPMAIRVLTGTASIFVAMLSGMLAGAGISTQPAVQATKGLHGSMMFTLSMPVSRFRLLATRASLGWLEMVGGISVLCCGMWMVFPLLRAATTPQEMFRYTVALLVCASALHCISVLLATFLDDLWRMWGSMLAFFLVWWIPNHIPLPTFADIFRAMGEDSPLLTHTMPWSAMAFALALATTLFLASLKIVQTREY